MLRGFPFRQPWTRRRHYATYSSADFGDCPQVQDWPDKRLPHPPRRQRRNMPETRPNGVLQPRKAAPCHPSPKRLSRLRDAVCAAKSPYRERGRAGAERRGRSWRAKMPIPCETSARKLRRYLVASPAVPRLRTLLTGAKAAFQAQAGRHRPPHPWRERGLTARADCIAATVTIFERRLDIRGDQTHISQRPFRMPGIATSPCRRPVVSRCALGIGGNARHSAKIGRTETFHGDCTLTARLDTAI